MSRVILDQNRIKCIDSHLDNYKEIIVTPMFMWEFFNNIGKYEEKRLIFNLKKIVNRIVISFKSSTCGAQEIKSGRISSFDMIIDSESTRKIRQLLKNKNPSISQIRDVFSPGFDPELLENKLNGLVNNSLLHMLQQEFYGFKDHSIRVSIIEEFKKCNEELYKEICYRTIQTCITILRKNWNYSEVQAIQFLRQPSILYNQAFGFNAIFMYRSTQTSKNGFNSMNLVRDLKDFDYLFFTHHIDHLDSNDNLMSSTFTHLKNSYDILSKTETGL